MRLGLLCSVFVLSLLSDFKDFFLIKKCSFSDEESGGQKMLLSV